MTTRACSRTEVALAEEAGAVDDLRLSAAQQAMSSRRQPPASVSQFRSFTARSPRPVSSTPRRDAVSQSLRGSADPVHQGSAPGDRFPYHHDPSPDRREPGCYQWFGPEDDGPGNDPDDPGNDGEDDDDDEDFLDATEELDANLAVFHNLALAVNRLSRSSRHTNESSSSRAKVRDPDTFDSTDPKKLRTFLVQCELCFQDRAKAFRLDRAKITFAQSYLKGMALEWFEPDLLESADPSNCPRWMDNWIAFVAELQSTFGPHNPVADAEHQLDLLQMKDSHRVTRYIVDFNRLASQIRGYGDGALRHYFYSGLPDRIKDELSRIGKPWTLDGTRALAQEIDARYWERKDEISRTSKSQSSTPANKSLNSGGNSTKSGQEKSKTGGNTSSGFPKPATKPTTSGSSKPDLTDKLGKDGKLTADERKRRLDNNLCMFCGGAGHFADKCQKKSKKAKARAAAASESVKPDSNSVATPESKKE